MMTDLDIAQRLLVLAGELDRLAVELAEHPDEMRQAHGRSLVSGAVLMRTWSLYVPPVVEVVR